MGDPERYRTKDDVERMRARDPILLFGRSLEDKGILDEAGLERIDREVAGEVDVIAEFADKSQPPAPEALFEHVYVNGAI
jgi:pyruvate dehydrogenase E1 component alpha subunit